MWRGDALSDFAVEQWATIEAARFAELRLTALTERAQIALVLGRQGEVVADLEPPVARDPTLESLTGLLMVALYRSGRQAEALEAYRRTREVLDESLGLEPSLTLRSLQAARTTTASRIATRHMLRPSSGALGGAQAPNSLPEEGLL